MKTLRLLSIVFVGSALTLSACSEKEDGSEETSTTNADDVGTTDGADAGEDFGDATEDDSVGDESDDGETGGSLFVPDSDIPGVASCDVWSQDCPDGEKCVAYASAGASWDANKCVAVTGDAATGDPCTYGGAAASTDDCDADNWCWDVDAENAGTCTPFCEGTPDNPMCGPGQSCSIANNGSITLCLTSCDPLLQDCAIDGTGCFWDSTGFVCANATSDIPLQEPCGFINDCTPGLVCLAPESFPSCAGASCCGEYCDLSDPVCTIPETECTAFFEEGTAKPGEEDIGVCIIPA